MELIEELLEAVEDDEFGPVTNTLEGHDIAAANEAFLDEVGTFAPRRLSDLPVEEQHRIDEEEENRFV